MKHALGVFTPRASIETTGDYVADHHGYYRTIWDAACNGPEIVRPKRCGIWDPFKLVADADLDSILRTDYCFTNGQACMAFVHRPGRWDSLYFNLTILLRVRKDRLDVVEEVYEWLKTIVDYRYVYRIEITQELFDQHLDFHQRVQTGVSEIFLPEALTKQDLFDRFEEKEPVVPAAPQ